MSLLRLMLISVCIMLISTEAASGEEVKAVGEEVSFTPVSPITKGDSIIWKHISTSGDVTKVIEYDEDGVNIWNNNFKGITSLDETTGEITLKKLTFSHTGVYTIDINSKEQTQRFSLIVKGEEVKAVGEEVSFTPASPITKGASIIWKHISARGNVTKAIEYDEDGVNIWNDNFKGITSLDETTGEITIKNLTPFHTGVYTIDINSKEQTQRFSLTVKERVPKPTITIEKSGDSKAAYLTCKYDESFTMELSIILKNSTGEIKTFKSNERSQSITVHSTGNPKNYYTCTLDNIASRATSDQVTEEQLFKEESSSGPGLTISLVLLFIFGLISAILAALYKLNSTVRNFFKERVPCLKGNAHQGGYTLAPPKNVENPKSSDETKSGNDVENPKLSDEEKSGNDGEELNTVVNANNTSE